MLIIQLLDKCLKGNKIAPLRSLATCAKGMEFYCPSRNYPAMSFILHYFSLFNPLYPYSHPFLAFFKTRLPVQLLLRCEDCMVFSRVQKSFSNHFLALQKKIVWYSNWRAFHHHDKQVFWIR